VLVEDVRSVTGAVAGLGWYRAAHGHTSGLHASTNQDQSAAMAPGLPFRPPVCLTSQPPSVSPPLPKRRAPTCGSTASRPLAGRRPLWAPRTEFSPSGRRAAPALNEDQFRRAQPSRPGYPRQWGTRDAKLGRGRQENRRGGRLTGCRHLGERSQLAGRRRRGSLRRPGCRGEPGRGRPGWLRHRR
jgi:hypothetical protein